MVVALDHL
jgi:hypothetical protein